MLPAGKDKRRFVQEKFAAVADRYDLLNTVLSLYVDHYWRRTTVGELMSCKDGPILDLCAGTLPLSVEIAKRLEGPVLAVDFCFDMLAKGTKSTTFRSLERKIIPVCGDGEQLPFDDGTFQGITIAFGIRNLSSTKKGLDEMRRVLAPGGKLAILEFSRPKVPILAGLYRFYLHKILPLIGGMLSGDRAAYAYLAESIQGFHAPGVLSSMMEDAGFEKVRHRPLTLGIVTLYTGIRRP